MKKTIVLMLLSLFVLGTYQSNVFAEENNETKVENIGIDNNVRKNISDNSMTDIKLNNLIITSEHPLETINVELVDTENKVIANVYSKGTSDLIESFSEEKAPNNLLQRAATSTYNSTVSARYRVGSSSSSIYVIAYANVNISAGTGWAQINKKPSSIWQSPDSSGNWVLKNKNQSVRTTTFPTTNMGLNIQGLVEISKSVSSSMGLSFKFLNDVGFDMSGTVSSNWYARKNYNSTVYIKTMW